MLLLAARLLRASVDARRFSARDGVALPRAAMPLLPRYAAGAAAAAAAAFYATARFAAADAAMLIR